MLTLLALLLGINVQILCFWVKNDPKRYDELVQLAKSCCEEDELLYKKDFEIYNESKCITESN